MNKNGASLPEEQSKTLDISDGSSSDSTIKELSKPLNKPLNKPLIPDLEKESQTDEKQPEGKGGNFVKIFCTFLLLLGSIGSIKQKELEEKKVPCPFW